MSEIERGALSEERFMVKNPRFIYDELKKTPRFAVSVSAKHNVVQQCLFVAQLL
ncbi:hypothetical protein KCP73_15600 [Salmonella enterica subsp. enterica]|nr:hypothetical protein KCP73_15600 [Salmonella enterica subsp. enterica]